MATALAGAEARAGAHHARLGRAGQAGGALRAVVHVLAEASRAAAARSDTAAGELEDFHELSDDGRKGKNESRSSHDLGRSSSSLSQRHPVADLCRLMS